MKKLLPIALMAAMLTLTIMAGATIRRVGWFGNPTAIDYNSLQAAHDAASPGDTIYLYPGSWSANISQKITLIGYGYFLNANPGLQVFTTTSTVSLYLYNGCDSSVFDGLDGLGLFLNNGAVIAGVKIKHCNLGNFYAYNESGNYSVGNLNGWQISQSNIQTFYYASFGFLTNLEVSNCIIGTMYPVNGNGTGNTGQFNNCVFVYPQGYNSNYYSNFGGGSFIVKNCIFSYYPPNSDYNCVYLNCLENTDNGTSGNFPAGTLGNQAFSFTTTPVFNTGSTSTDGQYAVAAGSPAKGAGVGGTDCGIFGGPNPYVLSGLPSVPAFTLLNAASNVIQTNPYNITFSVQSH